MRKKHLEINKLHNFTPSINFISPNETQPNQIKGIMTRSKTPFYHKKSAFSPEEENFSSSNLNKSINNQTFIYNSINFNNQGLFNNINNTNNINPKRRKSTGNNYMVNNGIMGFFETMKKSRSISKQKNSNHKYMNIINKLTNNHLFYKSLNKHKNKSNSKQKNTSFKNEKRKINTMMNTNSNIGQTYMNNTNTLHRKNRNKLMSTNYNTNKNMNMINVLNNNIKINHILASSTGKTKKVKKNTDINLTNKEPNMNKNKINLIKNIQFIDSDRNTGIKKLKYPEENKNNISEYEKNILHQIETLLSQLLSNCSSSKNIIIKELENTLKKPLGKYNINCKIENEINIPYKKKSNKNLNFSKSNSKNNLIVDSTKTNQRETSNKNNKNIIEKELNILNKKYNQIKEENINLKYLITEKTTAFEDVKNSLKNFQLEINQLKNNTGNNNSNQNPNSLRNKNEDYNIDSSIAGNISLNSKGVEMKNIKLNLSNIQKLNEIQNLQGTKERYGTKKESQENNTDANTNKENNIFNCNNYSFGQNNSFEINLENYNSSQKNILNSNRSLDPLSLTFHEQTINAEEDEGDIK